MLSVVSNEEVRSEKKSLKYPSFNNVFGFLSDIFRYDSILTVTRERDFFYVGITNIYGVYKVGYEIYGSDSNLNIPLQVCFSVSYKEDKILVPFKNRFYFYKWDKDSDFSWKYFGEVMMVGVSFFNDIILLHKEMRKNGTTYSREDAEHIIKYCSGVVVQLNKDEVVISEIISKVSSLVGGKISISTIDVYKRLGEKIGFTL